MCVYCGTSECVCMCTAWLWDCMCGFLADSEKVCIVPMQFDYQITKHHACLTYCASPILLVHSRNAVGGPELMVL